MRWIGDRESENIEDRRGVGGGLPVGIGGIGAIVVVLVGLFLGVDPSTLLALLSGDGTQQQTDTRRPDDGGYVHRACQKPAGRIRCASLSLSSSPIPRMSGPSSST